MDLKRAKRERAALRTAFTKIHGKISSCLAESTFDDDVVGQLEVLREKQQRLAELDNQVLSALFEDDSQDDVNGEIEGADHYKALWHALWTNKDVSKEKTPKIDFLPDSLDINPNLNSLWMYRPAPRTNLLQDEDLNQHPVQNKPPQSLTRLAKTISYGLNPYFHKVYFEPFEKRAKPVTLVGIRKNGQNARQTVYVPSKVASGEIAELQSPFNDISNFWLDELRNR